MINGVVNAGMFDSAHPTYCKAQFDLATGEEGSEKLDRPLIAQFCANDKTQFLQAAMALATEGVCDAVDLNLGCPQGIAKRGHYGAFLQEDMALIESLSKIAPFPLCGRSKPHRISHSPSPTRQPSCPYHRKIPSIGDGRSHGRLRKVAGTSGRSGHNCAWPVARAKGTVCWAC